MEDAGLKQRLLLFLYGTRNLAGSTLGMIGLGLHFAGVLDLYWPLIVAGLYGIGYLAAPGRPHPALLSQLEQASLREAIERIETDVRGKLPADAERLVKSIVASVETMAPKLDELRDKGSIVTDESFTVRETVTRYLPQTLEAYLRLPPAYASLHGATAGKAPKQLLIDQLALLDERLKVMLNNVLEEDLQALEANGRFLQEKFATGTLVPVAPRS